MRHGGLVYPDLIFVKEFEELSTYELSSIIDDDAIWISEPVYDVQKDSATLATVIVVVVFALIRLVNLAIATNTWK